MLLVYMYVHVYLYRCTLKLRTITMYKILTGILVPMATTTSPIVNSPIPNRQPSRATMVTIMKLSVAIQNMDIKKEDVTTYHFRFFEQLGIVHVNITKYGNERMNRIKLSMYLVQPRAPPSFASAHEGGAALIGGKYGMRVIVGSSSSSLPTLLCV